MKNFTNLNYYSALALLNTQGQTVFTQSYNTRLGRRLQVSGIEDVPGLHDTLTQLADRVEQRPIHANIRQGVLGVVVSYHFHTRWPD